jgi:hypothetical protein
MLQGGTIHYTAGRYYTLYCREVLYIIREVLYIILQGGTMHYKGGTIHYTAGRYYAL